MSAPPRCWENVKIPKRKADVRIMRNDTGTPCNDGKRHIFRAKPGDEYRTARLMIGIIIREDDLCGVTGSEGI